MAWNQNVAPNTGTQDYAGFCLRFTQSVFGAPVAHPTAWEAWLVQEGKHEDRNLPDVAVPLWFESWGTYGFGEYKNWGHACVWIPGRGILSSPGSGYGQTWFSSIEQAEARWGMKFVGWTENLNGLQVASWSGDSAPAPTPAPGVRTREIVSGDTLWQIATEEYGDGTRYMEIFNASSFRSGNPNLIFPGEIAVIP